MTAKKEQRVSCYCPACLANSQVKHFDKWSKLIAHWGIVHPDLPKPPREQIEMFVPDGYPYPPPPPTLIQPAPPVDISAAQEVPIGDSPDETAAVEQPGLPAVDQPAAGQQQPPPPGMTVVPTQQPATSQPPPQQQVVYQQPQYIQQQPASDPQATPFGQNIPRIDYDQMAEDPVARLAYILDVHGVPLNTRNQILTLVQMHPHFLQNPMNLTPVLQSMLDKKLHPRIQLMINSLITPPEPEPDPFAMMMPPYGGGQQQSTMGYQPYGQYPQQYGGGYPPQPRQQFYYPPPYGGPAPAAAAEQPMDKTLQLLTSLIKTMNDFSGGGRPSDEASELKQEVRDMKATVDRVVDESRKEREELREQHRQEMDHAKETSQAQIKALETALHEQQVTVLQGQIQGLQQQKAEDMSEGLGSLVRDGMEVVGGEVSAVRESVTDGVNRIADIVQQSQKGGGQQPAAGDMTASGQPEAKPIHRTAQEAAKLLEVQTDIDLLAGQLQMEAVAALPAEEVS